MKELKSLDLLAVPDSKRVNVILKVKRQVQQEALEQKLVQFLLSADANLNYPETISVAVEDLIRKAVEELKKNR